MSRVCVKLSGPSMTDPAVRTRHFFSVTAEELLLVTPSVVLYMTTKAEVRSYEI